MLHKIRCKMLSLGCVIRDCKWLKMRKTLKSIRSLAQNYLTVQFLNMSGKEYTVDTCCGVMLVLSQLADPCSQASYGRRKVGARFGKGVKVLAIAKPFGGLRSGTETGADQQEDPSPVRHNPGGLR